MSNTDTNQASELFELCEQVYEATGWKPTDWQHGIENGQPLYNSDYLLDKLPKNSDEGYPLTMGCIEEWRFYYWGDVIIEGKSDTPLKALLKLTIALSEAGELNDQSS